MKPNATVVLGLLMSVLMATPALAQMDVSIREINAYPQASIDELDAAGATLDPTRLAELMAPALAGQQLRITAVVLSNPRTSGLGNPTDGFPSRIHVYVRDTSAVSMGNEGMGIQLVDGAYQTTGLLNAAPGDVIQVVGIPNVFTGSGGASLQFEPESVELLGPYTDFNLPDAILDPVSVSATADVNKSVGANGEVQTNWPNLNSYNGQYIRIEGATIQVRDISSDRPNWLITTDGGTTVINFYDMSLRYRNDRDGGYNASEFNVSFDDFVPPPPGAKVNIQGFIVFQGDDPFNRSVPSGALLSMAPWEDADLIVTESPPQASAPTLDVVPAAAAATTVTATASADISRTLTGVTLHYFTSAASTDTLDLAMTDNGDGSFSADIPGQADGTFVKCWATATDNTGASTTSEAQEYRVLTNGIDEIADIQEVSGFSGDASPFTGLTLDMNLTATVQNNPAVNGREIAIQDNANLDPNTGVTVNPNNDLIADLQPGDEINITRARIVEDFGVTQLRDLVYTTVTEGGSILPYKQVTTDVLQDAGVAEAHEGMLLTFDDPIVTSTNPDDPFGPFGEWAVSSDGTPENAVRVDDRSNGISFTDGDAGTVFSVWERLDFIRGVWWFSFSNYKLMPDDLANDVGAVLNVGTEEEGLPGSFALGQNYPNPFNPATSIEYTVPSAGNVTLEVFDMMGRSVAVLVDGERAVGTYTIRFDAKSLASGLYLYRLTAGSNVQVKKMMLLR